MLGENLFEAFQSSSAGSRAYVGVGGKLSACFTVTVVSEQGCVRSPRLFNLYLDVVVWEVNASVMCRSLQLLGVNRLSCMFSRLLLAGATALVADLKMCRLVAEFGQLCEIGKLQVNVGKSHEMLE